MRPLNLQGQCSIPFPPITIPSPVLGGRLSLFVENWKKLTQDSWVLSTVQGYKITFHTEPYQRRIPTTVVNKDEDAFISEEVQSLLEKGAVVQHHEIFFKHFYSHQERGRTSPHNQPQISKQVCSTCSLQDGGNSIPEGYYSSTGFHDQTGSERHLFFHPSTSHSSDVSELQMERENIPIHLLTIWSLKCTSHIHKSNETSHWVPEVSRHSDGSLPGRHANPWSDQGGSFEMAVSCPELLENLGFLINYDKSELEPMQSLVFLGFLINTVTMEIKLPKEKVSQAVQEAQDLLQHHQASARQLAHLIGVFSSTLPAILPAPLHYRGLQNLKHQALKKGRYDVTLPLSEEAKEDLIWWMEHLPLVNGQPLVRNQPSLLMETDASLMGWGAVCEGEKMEVLGQ